jgi:hypothetical protein
MLTWNADGQFAIIGCAQLRKLRALARDMLPTNTGPWTEALNKDRTVAFCPSGYMSLFLVDWLDGPLRGPCHEHLGPFAEAAVLCRTGSASITDTLPPPTISGISGLLFLPQFSFDISSVHDLYLLG